jgi:hypothetical protein
MQFIEAVEKRDLRKTKHQGFFVNAGKVERIGDKPVKMRKRRRPADGEVTNTPVDAPAPPGRSTGEVRCSLGGAVGASCYRGGNIGKRGTANSTIDQHRRRRLHDYDTVISK